MTRNLLPVKVAGFIFITIEPLMKKKDLKVLTSNKNLLNSKDILY